MSEARAGRIPYTGVPDVRPGFPSPRYQEIQATPQEFGAQVGEALQRVGGELRQASDIYSEVAAQQAVTNWRTQVNKVLFGDPSVPGDVGYYGLRGQAAMEGRQGALQRIEDAAQQSLGTLGTARSQIMFNNEARFYQARVEAEIGSHYAQQSDAWAAKVQADQIKGSVDEAALRPQDEDAANAAFSRGYQGLVRGMISAGELPNNLDAATPDQLHLLHTRTMDLANDVTESRIKSLIGRGDAAGAAAIFNQHRDQLSTSKNFDAISGMIQRHASATIGNAALQQAEAAAGGGIASNHVLPPSAGMSGSRLSANAVAPEALVNQVKGLERSGDRDVSPAGAIGHMQVMPGTARQYGFDPSRLHEHDYNEQAGRTVINDLYRRYDGDASAVLVGYNAGPSVADEWIASGKDPAVLARHHVAANYQEAVGGGAGATFQPVTFVAGGALPAVAGQTVAPGLPTPQPSPMPQMQDLVNAQMENARRYARVLENLSANATLADDPVAYQHALQGAETRFRAQELAINAGKIALTEQRSAALDDYTRQILTPGADQAAIHSQMLADKRLDGETRQNLARLQDSRIASQLNGDAFKYGPQHDEARRRMLLPEGDPNRIHDPTQLLQMTLQKDEDGRSLLTTEGYKDLAEELKTLKTPEGVGRAQMIDGWLAYAKGRLSLEQDLDIGNMKIRDPEGENRYNAEFKPAFFAEIDKAVAAGEPLQKAMSREHLDEIIAQFERPPAQVLRDATIAGAGLTQQQQQMAGVQNRPSAVEGIPYGAVWLLAQHPEHRAAFDAKYGADASDKVLGPPPQPSAPQAGATPAPQATVAAPAPATAPAIPPGPPGGAENAPVRWKEAPKDELPPDQRLPGQAHLLPQYDDLGRIRPLGPGEYVKNPDGSWSNEMTITVDRADFNDGRPSVIPSLWLVNGVPTHVSDRRAVSYAVASGLVFPHFKTKAEAEAFAERRENGWQPMEAEQSFGVAPLWKRSVEQ